MVELVVCFKNLQQQHLQEIPDTTREVAVAVPTPMLQGEPWVVAETEHGMMQDLADFLARPIPAEAAAAGHPEEPACREALEVQE